MIDREARNQLLQGIDDYMDEKLSTKEFEIFFRKEIAPNTKDELVQDAWLWFYEAYDLDGDFKSNRLQSDCDCWKFFNRLRLLLASDTEYRIESQPRHRSLFHWVGGLSILTMTALVLTYFWLPTDQLLGICIVAHFLCGAATLATVILCYQPEPTRKILFAEYPFESFADLLAVRRSVPEFLSKRFPNKPPIPAPSQNRLIRFLLDTKCPAWVDRIGDAFVHFALLLIVAICFLPFLFVLWPLWVLLSLILRGNQQTRLILPGGSERNSVVPT
jgi:hypothetical protein